jgi:hypothetical protein
MIGPCLPLTRPRDPDAARGCLILGRRWSGAGLFEMTHQVNYLNRVRLITKGGYESWRLL